MIPEFEVRVHSGCHPHNIMLSGALVQWTPALKDLSLEHHGTEKTEYPRYISSALNAPMAIKSL